jgi:protein arginine kinase activator
MLCDECQKKSACVHITTIIGDKKIEKHLCENCAQKSGELNITQKLHNLFNSKAAEHLHDFIKEITSGNDREETLTQNMRYCKECGLTQFEFNKSGKFGCSACYGAFAQDLEVLLQKIHGAIEHKGKIARRSLAMMSANEVIENLRSKIKNHIALEEYEQAAAIRDEIRTLEANLPVEEELTSKGEVETL